METMVCEDFTITVSALTIKQESNKTHYAKGPGNLISMLRFLKPPIDYGICRQLS